MPKSTTFCNDLINLIFRSTPIAGLADNDATTPLTVLYLSLHTADPGVGGAQTTNEASYTGYARLAVDRTGTGWDAASLGATVNSALGNLMLETKRYKEAAAYFDAALSADREEGFYRGMADDLRGIGRACFEMGERAKAVKYWEQSAKIYAVLGLGAEAGRTMTDIRAAVPGTGVDTRITELFVKRWLEGKLEGTDLMFAKFFKIVPQNA